MSRIPPPTPLLRRPIARGNKLGRSASDTTSSFVNTQHDNQRHVGNDLSGSFSKASLQSPSSYHLSMPSPLRMNSSPETSPLTDSYDSFRPSEQQDNIRVVLRIRPIGSPQVEDPLDEDDNQPLLTSPLNPHRCLEVPKDNKTIVIAPMTLQEKRFSFDRVFTPHCSQEVVFQDTGLNAVENALNGFNGCIFAYGQTGSGKTFTMLGGNGEGQFTDAHELKVSPLRGLMPRIFDHLFRRLDEMVSTSTNDLQYILSCSYLEIYNEKIYDLFDSNTLQSKSLREDSKKQVYVDNLRHIPIKSASQAVEWLQVGSSNRKIAVTDMNRESSRSHAVFTVRLVQTQQSDSGTLMTRRSNLHLVDLAGSEKQKQTKSKGNRLKEAAQINKSLSALGNVIMALVDVSNGVKRHVHYRDSKLTFLLRDSLGGNSITTIIATITEEEKYFSETLSTLKFAQRAKCIKNKAIQNEDSDTMIPFLKEQIERLRQEIVELKQKGVETYYAVPHEVKKKENRWEPALEVMQRLLKASGAASPMDIEPHEDCASLEVRCQRLEMLLYRMICRYEEHKVLSFSSHHGYVHPGTQSLLPQPKTRYQSQRTNNVENQQDVDELQQELAQKVLQCDELEAENTLLRQQLCECMKIKHNPSTDELSTASDELRVQYEDVLEVLNTYRSVFREMSFMVDEKRSPRSHTESNFTEDTSQCGTSTIDDDEEDYFDSDEIIDEEGTDLFGPDREIRRIQTMTIKIDRQMEKYQQEIQRLENNHRTVQDELETSITAHTFAKEQIELLRRTLAQREKNQETEMAVNRDKLVTAQEKINELTTQIATLSTAEEKEENESSQLLEKTLEDNEELRQTVQTLQEEMNSHDIVHAQQIETLRKENEFLRQRVETTNTNIVAMKNHVKSMLAEPSSKSNKDEPLALEDHVIQRLRAERHTLETRVAHEQQKVRRLEAELARAQNAQARNSFATDLFCSM